MLTREAKMKLLRGKSFIRKKLQSEGPHGLG